MISIRQPLCFSEIGKKETQEDFLFPSHSDMHTRIFILCDGMGGHDNGEVASKTAATALGNYLSSHSDITPEVFEAGLSESYDALDSIDTNSAKKPGTTMTCLCLNEDSYLVAHIGDSRIYHIRPSLYNSDKKRGGILYQSSDHSLVNDLLKAGEIDEEEARVFPHKNVITRAMQPHLQRRYKADVFMFDNIETGDYFFMCCDGILEQLDNDTLCRILANQKIDDRQKLAEIKSICDDKTRDNYTCWLIPVDKVEIRQKSKLSPIIAASLENSIPGESCNKENTSKINNSGEAPISVIPVNEDPANNQQRQQDLKLNSNEEKKIGKIKIRIPEFTFIKLNKPDLKIWGLRLLYIVLLFVIVFCAIYFIKTFTAEEPANEGNTLPVKQTSTGVFFHNVDIH